MAASNGRRRSGGGRARFGTLLAGALKRRGLRQDDLAAALGTTQSSVSGWINGRYEPAAAIVFAIERALDLEPGHLSRPLGYLPVDHGTRPVSVEVAIVEDDLLDDDQKAVLKSMYQVLVRDSATSSSARRRARLAGGRRVPSRPRSVAGSR